MSNDLEFINLRGRVIELEAQIQYLYTHFGLTYAAGPNTKIMELIRKNDMMGAIKLHRELYNSSLVDAKQAVEKLAYTLK